MVGSPAICKVTGTRIGATSPVIESKHTTVRIGGKYHRGKSFDVVVKGLRRGGRISGANGNDTFRSSYRDTTCVRVVATTSCAWEAAPKASADLSLI